ncbi:hypothetical protein B0H11DRAFT_2224402 [Mycena galericulata]|nr:hypothetical protein B0H11DRAFT_2224402 [Mycena galericulata]
MSFPAPGQVHAREFRETMRIIRCNWFVAGNEIAHHTITHVGDLPNNEISGNLIALNSVAGIPLASIHGFCAPYLNYSIKTAKLLHAAHFTHDSSSTGSPDSNLVSVSNSDARPTFVKSCTT